MDWPIILLAIAVGYLFGSLSFARLGVKLFAPEKDLANVTITLAGTDETADVGIFGANAASMILGPRLGCAVALMDMAKVALPVLAFRLAYPGQVYHLVVALTGLVGHNWPVYYRFRGGRGFSVIFGSFVVIDWLGAIVSVVAGLAFGMVILGNPVVAYMSWLWLMIPWFVLRTRDPAHIAYAIAVNVLFALAIIPEARTILRYRREGKMEAYMQGLTTSSPRWRGMKQIAQRVRISRLWEKRRGDEAA